MPDMFDIAVIGGGAAGLAASIGAARRGRRVAVCDRMPRLGKKILVTGGGRCNLLNEDLDPRAFTATDSRVVASVFERFGKEPIRNFFAELGLKMVSESDGRVFPATNQAGSVLKVLEIEIRRLGVAVEFGFEVEKIDRRKGLFTIAAKNGRRIEAGSLVLACGGKSYPALGSNGSGYELAGRFGHRIVPPVPSAVPLLVKDRLCHFLQGQKLRARTRAVIDGKDAGAAEGEILFTQYGLSGTAVLDVSEPLSVALNREDLRDVSIIVDFVPLMTEAALAVEIGKRVNAGWAFGDLISGILPEKFGTGLSGLIPAFAAKHGAMAETLASTLKKKTFAVTGTRGWNEAEFTSGGVDSREIDPMTLKSARQKGLYLAGEILDVQGKRGGFNLAWAWASGYLAGESSGSTLPSD